MGGNKAIAAAVLIVVILGAVIIIIKQQSSSSKVPQWVLDQQHKYILAEPPWTVKEYRYGDIMGLPIDKATGYRVIDAKNWASPMTCATSQKEGKPHQIPVPPRAQVEPTEEPPGEEAPPEDDIAKPYKCPICGKEANPEVLEMGGASAPL